MKVRLTRKFADTIDDIDLSAHAPGDVIRLPEREARMLIAEGWATLIDSRVAARDRRATPSDRRDAASHSSRSSHR